MVRRRLADKSASSRLFKSASRDTKPLQHVAFVVAPEDELHVREDRLKSYTSASCSREVIQRLQDNPIGKES
jgi:hypothetical protein